MTRPGRILFLIGSLREGGAEGQVLLLMRGLKERGHTVGLVLLHPQGARLQEARDEGFEIFGVDLPRFRPRWSPLPWLRLPGALRRTVRFIRDWQPDVVHAWLFWGHFWARLALLLLPPVPFITSRRQTMSDKGKSRLLAQLENWINKRTYAVIANSRGVARSVKRKEKNLPPRCFVIHNGIDERRIEMAPPANLAAEFPLLADAEVIVITVANLLPHKGYPDLLQAWKMVTRAHQNAKLLCVGADGGQQRKLERMRAELGLDRHVLFAGSRQDVPSLIKGADLAVHSSRDEGMSNAVAEYMCCGMAVIATDVAGTEELIDHEICGLIVPVGETEKMANAILSVIESPSLRRNLAQAARQKIQLNFSSDRMVRAYEKLYAEAYQRSTIPP